MQWHLLDIFAPIQTDRDTATFGGVVSSHNTDLTTKRGAVMARRAESRSIENPDRPHNVASQIHAGRNLSGAEMYAVLTKSAHGSGIPHNGVGVQGANVLPGVTMPVEDGWQFPDGIQPAESEIDAMLDVTPREIRLHAREPKFYGIPRSVIEPTTDFKYVTGLGEAATLPTGDKWIIEGPVGESNGIEAPSADDFRVVYSRQNRLGNSIEFGDVPFWGPPSGRNADGREPGRFEYACFAVSYLYDGYQESPLTLLPTVLDLNANASGVSEGCRSIYFDFLMRNIRAADDVRNTPKRVRKIRLYCAPSVFRLSNPLQSGTFYLAAEIDVADWDVKSNALRYQLPVVDKLYGDNYHDDVVGGRRQVIALEFDVNVGWADDGDREGRNAARRWDEFEDGAPWIRLNNNETYYPCKAVATFRRDDADINSRVLVVFTNEWDQAEIEAELARCGDRPTVSIGHAFRPLSADTSDGLVHRIYLGDELLGRPTYNQLSGLLQTEEVVGPPRKGGYSGFDVEVIWNVRDKDEVWHDDRMMWACFSPSGVRTPDRFPLKNSRDFGFKIVGVIRSGGYLAVFGERDLVFGAFIGDALQWEFSDVYPYWGCAAARSICETPMGVFYLGMNGSVRLISGNQLVPTFNSDAIRDAIEVFRGHWEHAVGCYSPRHEQYILHFPVGGAPNSIRTFVYDFRVQGWLEATLDPGTDLVLSPLPAYCATTDTDGDGLLGTAVGFYKFGASDTRLTEACSVTVRTHFDDVLGQKTVQHQRLIYDAGDADVVLTITPEDMADRPNDPLFGEQIHTALPSVVTDPHRIALTDRMFTFKVEKFEKVGAWAVEVEPADGKQQSA